jgi:hypothetical protein
LSVLSAQASIKDKQPMKQLVAAALGLVLLLGSSAVARHPQASKTGKTSTHVSQHKQAKRNVPVEEFSFLIKDFKIDHQTETNTLNISISFRYVANIANADYPDFRWLAKDVETLLTNYPNDSDYWEIVNKQITALLMKKYPSITSVTCELKVEPSRLVPYTRSSRVTRTRP